MKRKSTTNRCEARGPVKNRVKKTPTPHTSEGDDLFSGIVMPCVTGDAMLPMKPDGETNGGGDEKFHDGQSNVDLATSSLRAVLLDNSASSQAKASAARTLLELEGRLGRHAVPPDNSGKHKSLTDLSIEELDAELAEHREKIH